MLYRNEARHVIGAYRNKIHNEYIQMKQILDRHNVHQASSIHLERYNQMHLQGRQVKLHVPRIATLA
jgi:hypothetical protein